MKRLFAIIALLPTPALADLECSVARQCGGGTCEAYAGGPFLIEEAGDAIRVSADGQVWEGYITTGLDVPEISIVLPPQNGMSGLISVFPSGEFLFTAHAMGDTAVAITGEGTCQGLGG